jgi:hypothetical protein
MSDDSLKLIDAFFEEFDRRVAEQPDWWIAELRPILKANAERDPEDFAAQLRDFFAELEQERT